MGIRMFQARDAFSRLMISAENASRRGTYRCEHCDAALTPVKGQVIRGDDNFSKRLIPSFFRLRPRIPHGEGCLNSLSGYVVHLRARASAVEDVANPFEDHGKSLRFRLNIPYTIATQGRLGQTTEEFRRHLAETWTSGVLDHYCRSAVGLAKLWHVIESKTARSELRTAVSIAVDGVTVRWDQFAFSFDHYGRLADELEDGTIGHPVAVLVVPKSSTRFDNGRTEFKCVAEPVGGGPQDVRVAPVIWMPTDISDRFMLYHQYLVFGYWKFDKSGPWRTGAREILFRNIKVNVQRPAQYTEVEVSVEM